MRPRPIMPLRPGGFRRDRTVNDTYKKVPDPAERPFHYGKLTLSPMNEQNNFNKCSVPRKKLESRHTQKLKF